MVSHRPSLRMMPSAPSAQLTGAMFAPAQSTSAAARSSPGRHRDGFYAVIRHAARIRHDASVQKTVPARTEQESYSGAAIFGPSRYRSGVVFCPGVIRPSCSAQYALKGLRARVRKQANQQGHTIQVSRFSRWSIRLDARKLPFEVARKVRG